MQSLPCGCTLPHAPHAVATGTCVAEDWGTDLTAKQLREAVFDGWTTHLSQLTGWLHRHLHQQAQGTSLELKQAAEKERRGIG